MNRITTRQSSPASAAPHQRLPAEFQRLETLAPELVQRASRWYMSDLEAVRAIRERSGLIPIQVTADGRALWADVGQHAFTEWKFRSSVAAATVARDPTLAFSTDLSLLERDDLVFKTLTPTGFIFQVSRCGSTLLARALARSPRNNVINEASPLHEGFWGVYTDSWRQGVERPERVRALRNLVLAVARRRTAEQRRAFVKFRSWNVVFIAALRRAFPEVPFLFIYRDPAEVLVSALTREPFGYTRLKGTPAAGFILGCSARETASMDTLTFLARMHAAYLRAALAHADPGLRFIDYEQLRGETLGELLSAAFRCAPSRDELARMHHQFAYYSKDESGTLAFTRDGERKRALITDELAGVLERELAELYESARREPRNLELGEARV